METNNQVIDIDGTKKAIKEKFGTLTAFADKLGIDGSNLSKKLDPPVSYKFMLELKEHKVFVSKQIFPENVELSEVVKEPKLGLKKEGLSNTDKDKIIKELLIRIDELNSDLDKLKGK